MIWKARCYLGEEKGKERLTNFGGAIFNLNGTWVGRDWSSRTDHRAEPLRAVAVVADLMEMGSGDAGKRLTFCALLIGRGIYRGADPTASALEDIIESLWGFDLV